MKTSVFGYFALKYHFWLKINILSYINNIVLKQIAFNLG